MNALNESTMGLLPIFFATTGQPQGQKDFGANTVTYSDDVPNRELRGVANSTIIYRVHDQYVSVSQILCIGTVRSLERFHEVIRFLLFQSGCVW